MALPRAPDRLSDDMAAAIGHAVSAFGFLEEALKRAIFSLTRQQLGQDETEAAAELGSTVNGSPTKDRNDAADGGLSQDLACGICFGRVACGQDRAAWA